ncbi:conserved hypothetical protein [Dethiosulfovibrio peptidovorans DSM 11002]|uniref:Sulphur transport domain-containing protein n=1 Tax=Dethiosulfovibrio peptidovorans DSM 11002 TaxID=469381 RepID=D2Z2G8_9BACT|nr:YedE family putative selenium transporter [Dethiosulfovibrio peptidovorans]EFC90124.1 conserved hypothetical protein [Dethiosulfovibrio peptidovorans DSM 11002]
MKGLDRILLSRMGPIVAGIAVGVLAPLLVHLGNPGNMGICVACFERDIAGALGLHRAGVVQYLRPEIMGIILGAFLSAMAFGEYRPRSGSSPVVRFFLGMFAMIGALIFLGCPWRGYLRLAGGDWNALFGLAGLFVGIGIGIFFLWRGFSLGRSHPEERSSGLMMPLMALGLLALLLIAPKFGAEGSGPVFFSAKGPGSMYAPWVVSLIVGLSIGWLAQRSRFCTVGSVRDLFMLKDSHLFNGIIALLIAAVATNYALGLFKPGFAGQPVAHTDGLWNFLGMVLAGLSFTLAGGCPGRQLIMSGEGDGDAAVFVLGMVAGAGIAHNFSLASSPKGITPYAPGAWIVGMIFCLAIGFMMRQKLD